MRSRAALSPTPLSRPVKVAGRIALWGAIVLVLGRGLVSLFAGTGAGGAPAPAPERAEGFPVVEAQAFAARFAADYLTYDEIDPSDWAARTAPYGAATAAAWDGKGRQSVTSVIPAGVEVQGPGHAVVTIAARTADGWVHLAVPIAATKGGLTVFSRPAFVPVPVVGRAPEGDAGEVDSALTEALRPTVEAFLAAYASGQTAVTRAMSADRARFSELESDRFTLASLDDLVVPKAKKGEVRTALATVRWSDARSGATLTQSYRLGLTRDGDRWLVNDLGAARPEPNQAKKEKP